MESRYADWTMGENLSDGITQYAMKNKLRVILVGNHVHTLILHGTPKGRVTFGFQVLPCPDVMNHVLAIQRAWRRAVGVRATRRRLALAMGGHGRLGAGSGIHIVDADILREIWRFV